MPKTYEYKVYDSSNTYLGSLKNVSSEFSYNQTINTTGSQLDITLAIGFNDVGPQVDSDDLIDTDGNQIITETLDDIVTRLDYTFDEAPISLGNQVTVYEYSDLYPNGLKVFDGIIVKWNATVNQDTIQVTVFSYGYELSQYIITEASDLQLEQELTDDTVEVYQAVGKDPLNAVAQSFSVPVEVSISGVQVYMSAFDKDKIASVRFELYEDTPDSAGALLGSVSKNYLTSETGAWETFNFGSTLTLPAGSYHFVFYNAGSATASYTDYYVHTQTGDVYDDGSFWEDTSGTFLSYAENTDLDMAFRLNASSGTVLYSFSALDTGSGVRQAMLLYQNQGGAIQHTDDTVETTGTNMYYSFNINSAKDIIDKCLDVSPASYYYYINPATNVLYFKDRSISPDHILKNGVDLGGLNIERTIDELQNIIYFSGGDTGGGENLLMVNKNTASVNQYGQWSAQLSDNRVTVLATAEKYTQASLDANSEPKYRVTCEVLTSEYDTSTINVGDMIKITGNGNLIDELMLQIVEKSVTPYVVRLTLGSIQPRTTSTIQRLSQQMELQEKENNPDEVA